MIVYPVGTEQDPSGRRVALLMEQAHMLLFDCRIVPWSWRTTWQRPQLEQRWGTRYRFAGAYLGNAKHEHNKAHPGKLEIELVNPRVGIPCLRSYLLRGHDAILLCACLDYEQCHLHEVVRLLQEALPGVEVVLQPAIKWGKGYYTVVVVGAGFVVKFTEAPNYEVQEFAGSYPDPAEAKQEFKSRFQGYEYLSQRQFEQKILEHQRTLARLRAWNH